MQTVIACPPLHPLESGRIMYSTSVIHPYSLGTIATYRCNNGYSIYCVNMTTCDCNDNRLTGYWNGDPPSCLSIGLR